MKGKQNLWPLHDVVSPPACHVENEVSVYHVCESTLFDGLLYYAMKIHLKFPNSLLGALNALIWEKKDLYMLLINQMLHNHLYLPFKMILHFVWPWKAMNQTTSEDPKFQPSLSASTETGSKNRRVIRHARAEMKLI